MDDPCATVATIFAALFFVVAVTAENFLTDRYGGIVGGVAAGLLLFALTPLQRFSEHVPDRAMPHVRDDSEYRLVTKLEVFRAAYEGALEDGVVTEKERDILARLQDQLDHRHRGSEGRTGGQANPRRRSHPRPGTGWSDIIPWKETRIMTRALAATACLTLLIVLSAEGVSSQSAPGGEAGAAEATVRSFFDALEALDFEALERTVTSDMELVEDTLILDMPGFIGFVRPLAEGGMRFRYRLTDFNTEVRGPVAWTRYRNEGVMTMDGQQRRFDWIESAVLERSGEGWKIDRLQSAPVRIVPPLDPDPDVEAALAAEISREVDRATTAWTALEPQPYLDLFSGDVTWLYEGAGIDRATFEDMVRQYMAVHMQADWRMGEWTVEVLGPDAAVVSGSWKLAQTDTAGLKTEDAGAITLVYERRNGEWKIVHAHESLPGAGSIGSQGDDEPSTRSSSMDAEAMKDLASRWIHGIWDNQDVDLLDELATRGYTYSMSNNEPMGRDAFAAFVQSIGTAFPDIRNTIEEQVVNGGLVITRGVTVATHGGPLGELEATGRTVSVPFVMYTRFQDGRIASDWELFDQAGMMAQLTGNDH